MKWDLLFESIKEPLRLLVLGLVAYAITHFSNLPETEGTAIILTALRFIDALLHEYGKYIEETKGVKSEYTTGLTRF